MRDTQRTLALMVSKGVARRKADPDTLGEPSPEEVRRVADSMLKQLAARVRAALRFGHDGSGLMGGGQ